MEPSGEQCEVPVVKPSEVKKMMEGDQTDPNEVAEVEKDTEHQFVFTDKKVDGSSAQQDQVSKPDTASKDGAAVVTK